ncbi:MAG TPA: AAA family ATPase, partial [Planctomycetaceae bacterium]
RTAPPAGEVARRGSPFTRHARSATAQRRPHAAPPAVENGGRCSLDGYTGQRGVGKTTLVWELARRAAAGELPSLQDSRFLWVDCQDVAPEESRARFAALLAHLADYPDLIVCLDGLGSLLRAEGGVTNKLLLRTALRQPRRRIIGVMSQWDFDELLASESEILDVCTRVEVPEPDETMALDIVRQAARQLEVDYQCRISPEALGRLVALSGRYIWNQCFPTKAIRVLERACEDAMYLRAAAASGSHAPRGNPRGDALRRVQQGAARTMAALQTSRENNDNEGHSSRSQAPLGNAHSEAPLRAGRVGEQPSLRTSTSAVSVHPGGATREAELLGMRCQAELGNELKDETDGTRSVPATLSADDVIRVVSEISRVPIETLTGDIDDTDYEQILGSAVVGQDEAVSAVASELRLIKAGITDPGKPASVMLFCGLNGVGKTELAKRLAEIYSTSKRLQIYTMGNFVESHSVSGIIGVPAGYVGHDQGGRLINDLNADPYGVFLLDEIEKSHPDVLKPFLNLFDEGWIVDQKGVKGYADRAIFILTSNAGYEAISQMHQDKRPMADIVEHVKSSLARVRNERSGQPVLSQAFLARIKRIQIFNPLTEPAMLGITRILLDRVQHTWLTHRGKTIVVSDELIQHIAAQGQAINVKSGGREGGRGIRRLIAELVEDRIQLAAIRSKAGYARCRTIRLTLKASAATNESSPPGGTAAKGPEIDISFE